MNKELTPLEHLQFIREYEIDDDHYILNYNYAIRQSLDIIETTLKENDRKLKALEIIGKKNVDVGAIKNCVNAYAYNDFKELTETKLIKREKLTQEDFASIKEVLL